MTRGNHRAAQSARPCPDHGDARPTRGQAACARLVCERLSVGWAAWAAHRGLDGRRASTAIGSRDTYMHARMDTYSVDCDGLSRYTHAYMHACIQRRRRWALASACVRGARWQYMCAQLVCMLRQFKRITRSRAVRGRVTHPMVTESSVCSTTVQSTLRAKPAVR